MRTTKSGAVKNYTSPQAEVLRIESETVLCQSDIDEVTLNTGANWSVGDDAEW